MINKYLKSQILYLILKNQIILRKLKIKMCKKKIN